MFHDALVSFAERRDIIRTTNVDVEAMKKDADEIFQKGFACSESVIYAIKKGFDLAGGTMCIGYFFGRRSPGDDAFLKCQRLTKELHDAFKEHSGSTCCRVLTRGKEKILQRERLSVFVL